MFRETPSINSADASHHSGNEVARTLRQSSGWSRNSDVLGVLGILGRVPRVLSSQVHFVLLDVRLEDIVGAHSQHLRHADEEVQQVDHFDPRVLFIEFLVLRPPFPRNAVRQFRQLLVHGTTVVEDPMGLLGLIHLVGKNPDTLIERLLHSKKFTQLVRRLHGGIMIELGAGAQSSRIQVGDLHLVFT